MINKNKLLSVKKLAATLLITMSTFSTTQAACPFNEEAFALEARQWNNPQRRVAAQARAPEANFIEELEKNAERDLYGRLPKLDEGKKIDLSKEEEKKAIKKNQQEINRELEALVPIEELVTKAAKLVENSRILFPRVNKNLK